MDSLSQIIYEGLQTLNGDNTNSLYKNKHDAIDKMLTSTTSTESLRAKVERWLVNEETEGDSLEARLNYWLRQRVDYELGDSLNRLIEKYFVLNNLVNENAIQHLTYFTDTEWVDIINGYDAQLVSSNCLSVTTGSTLTFATELESADSIINSGTATVTLSTTGITVTGDGTLFEVYVNGILFPFAEGYGDYAYGESNTIAITGGTWTTQDDYHYNLLNGFDLYEDTSRNRLRVPIGSTVSDTSFAFVKTFKRSGYIPAETKFKQPDVQALKDADDGQFYTGGVANELSYEEIINATDEQEVIGVESTVGTDGQAQMISGGLTVQNKVKENDLTSVSEWIVGSNITGFSLTNQVAEFVGGGIPGATRNNWFRDGVVGDYGDNVFVCAKMKAETTADAYVGIGYLSHATKSLSTSYEHVYDIVTITDIVSNDDDRTFNICASSGDKVYVDGNFANGGGVFAVKLEGNIADITEEQALFMVRAMQPGTDLQFCKNPKWTSTHSDTIQKSIKTILGEGGADVEFHSNVDVADYVDEFGKIHQNVDHTTNATLATPIITDAQITIVDENGNLQDYWHLYENGQISGEAEELLPIGQIVNLQNGENIFARTHPTKSDVIVYSKPISGLDQDYARAFVGRPLAENFRLLDSNGDYLFDSNNDALFVTGV